VKAGAGVWRLSTVEVKALLLELLLLLAGVHKLHYNFNSTILLYVAKKRRREDRLKKTVTIPAYFGGLVATIVVVVVLKKEAE